MGAHVGLSETNQTVGNAEPRPNPSAALTSSAAPQQTPPRRWDSNVAPVTPPFPTRHVLQCK